MANFVKLCLTAFQLSLQQTLPAECVKRSLSILSTNESSILTVNNREYPLHQNVHIVAIGKAACGMVAGAERILNGHLVDGVASIPVDANIPEGLKTHFYKGADNNLPDGNALRASEKITDFLSKIRNQQDQIVLFLISGGGSALLPSPISGLSLEEKLKVIRILTQNGADIKQLNVVRSALSTLKGGKLARLGAPSKMISLIMSDVIGDPIDLISSGPTVLEKSHSDTAFDVFAKLNVSEKIPKNVYDILNEHILKSEDHNKTDVDINNTIVCNNRLLLNTLADNFRKEQSTEVLVVTSTLEGDASELGAKFAKLIVELGGRGRHNVAEVETLLRDFYPTFVKDLKNFNSSKRLVLLFGGESTVRFPPKAIAATAKGGRNQELILAALKNLVSPNSTSWNATNSTLADFALFSLGTDGQDGPTDATGAFIAAEDINKFEENFEENERNLTECLEGKNSYEFWTSKWSEGRNLVKFGKTGTNLMDVQILFLEFY